MQDTKEGSRRKKICFVITKGVWGGAGKYVYTLATNLPKETFEPIVICGEGEALPEKLKQAQIKTYRLERLARDISIIAEIRSSFALLQIVRAERPDVLHLNSPKAGGFGAIAGRLSGVKQIIYTAHGFAWNEKRGGLSQFLIGFFSWLTIMLCHKTIVINEKEKRQVLAMPFVTENKITLIHNGIEKIEFKKKDEARKELLEKTSKPPFENNTKWFGTIAELHKNKGLEYAIAGVSKIQSPFVFFILGGGEERKNLENLIEKYNLQEKVFLLGFVEHGSQYLKAFDLFLLTSIKEGLPFALLEAGLAGLPVIASNITGIPDIVENGEGGILVTRGREGEITRAIEFLLDNPDKQKSFAEHLKNRVEKEFSLKQMIEKTFALYKN